MKPIVLSKEETLELSVIAGSRSLPYGLVTRAKIILMSAEGLANRDIAAEVEYSTQSVALWRKRYRDQGIRGLHDELRSGRPRSIADEQVAELVRKTLQIKP
jgi:putative transposase